MRSRPGNQTQPSLSQRIPGALTPLSRPLGLCFGCSFTGIQGRTSLGTQCLIEAARLGRFLSYVTDSRVLAPPRYRGRGPCVGDVWTIRSPMGLRATLSAGEGGEDGEPSPTRPPALGE